MLRAALFFLCVVACRSHAVLPIVVPAVHSAPLAAPYGVQGYGVQGYGVQGYAGHGLLQAPGWAAPVHHVLKRSPIFVPLDPVAPLAGPLGAVAPAAHIAPVAVSHQSRVDVRTSPAVVAAPVLPVKAVAVPLLHKSFLAAPYHYGHNALPYYGQ